MERCIYKKLPRNKVTRPITKAELIDNFIKVQQVMRIYYPRKKVPYWEIVHDRKEVIQEKIIYFLGMIAKHNSNKSNQTKDFSIK